MLYNGRLFPVISNLKRSCMFLVIFSFNNTIYVSNYEYQTNLEKIILRSKDFFPSKEYFQEFFYLRFTIYDVIPLHTHTCTPAYARACMCACASVAPFPWGWVRHKLAINELRAKLLLKATCAPGGHRQLSGQITKVGSCVDAAVDSIHRLETSYELRYS